MKLPKLHLRDLFWLVLAFAWLFGCCGTATAQPSEEEAAAAAKALRGPIEKLIAQLGADEFSDREAASKELLELGNSGRRALEEAATSKDPEIASRAIGILSRFAKLTHTVLDALGAPIPLAKVEVRMLTRTNEGEVPEELPSLTSIGDDRGRVAIPTSPNPGARAVISIAQPKFGRTRFEYDLNSQTTTIQLPLVREASEAYGRACKGTVVDSDGKPIAEAVVRCDNIRTPDEVLIDGISSLGDVLTDAQGRFALYPPDKKRDEKRGGLIPQDSHYALRVTVPKDDTCFPLSGRFANTAPVRLEMRRTVKFFRFRFEADDGGIVKSAEDLRNIQMQFDQSQGDERFLIPLDQATASQGGKLPAGKYLAKLLSKEKVVHYQPMEVTAESPDELLFRLPAKSADDLRK